MEIMMSLLLHKLNLEPWTEEELNPILGFSIYEITKLGSAYGVDISFSDGTSIMVDYVDIDGNKSC
jgi:hypothetical protein